MVQTHAFISYVRENKGIVDRLVDELQSHGVEVWLDRNNIVPGQRWQDAVKNAIQNGAFFIACFSRELEQRERSYVHEELLLAIDELRKMPRDRVWFIPVLLNEAKIPSHRISDSETIASLSAVSLYEGWERGIANILRAMNLRVVKSINPVKVKRSRLAKKPRFYVERRSLYDRLLSELENSISSKLPTAIILYGPRGCGKSTLAEDLCDQVESRIKVHKLNENREPDPTLINRGDLVLVDAFMNTKEPDETESWLDEAEAWLERIPARFLIITTRLREAVHAVKRATESGTNFVEREMGGFTRDEFLEAIDACRRSPGCDHVQLDSRELALLYQRTGGFPLAVQVVFNLLRSPAAQRDSLVFLDAQPPEEVLNELLLSWRRKVAESDEQLDKIIFILSNVPIIGISKDAIAMILSWQEEQVESAL